MKILLDGQEVPFVEGLVQKMEGRLEQKNMVIRSLTVNGVEMVNASLAEALAEPAKGKVVEITTDPAEVLLWEAMRDARDYIPRLRAGLPRIREQLLQGNVNAVHTMVDEALEGLQWLGLTFQAFISQGKAPQAEKVFTLEYSRFGTDMKELEEALRSGKLEAACNILEQQVMSFLDKLQPLAEEITAE